MARSHHRKKHKQHLKQFKSAQEAAASGVSPSNRVSATWIFSIGGLILGLAISYFAAGGSALWIAAGALAGTAAGYFIGKKIDSGKV